jgi:AhpD family alkylhydroperoxidase
MARISFVKPHGPDLLRRLTFSSAKRMYGRVLEPVQVIAHHRPLLFGYGLVSLAHERFSHTVEAPLKNLAMLRTAQLVGCEWCLDFGSYLARESGIAEPKLRALSAWRESDQFDRRERLALELAEATTRTPVEVSDELFARLRAEFDERQIIELTMSITLENLHSRTNWALGIEGQGFSEGSYCVRPDAPAELVGVRSAR